MKNSVKTPLYLNKLGVIPLLRGFVVQSSLLFAINLFQKTILNWEFREAILKFENRELETLLEGIERDGHKKKYFAN